MKPPLHDVELHSYSLTRETGGSSGVYDHEGRVLVVNDARSPFDPETADRNAVRFHPLLAAL
ncbi:MAG: hypothetical protein ACK5N9_20265, partial [Pirellula sp.]